MAARGEDEVPRQWMQRLLDPANLRGDGDKAEKLLGVTGQATGQDACIRIGDSSMTFEDIALHLQQHKE